MLKIENKNTSFTGKIKNDFAMHLKIAKESVIFRWNFYVEKLCN